MRLVVWLGLTGCGIENVFQAHMGDDFFYQSPDDRVDILWVIDNSSSMTEEQDALVNGFESFVDAMDTTGGDFQMAVITTSVDVSDPQSVRFLGTPPILTPDTDYVSLFQERARVGIQGDDRERGLMAASLALSDEALGSWNAGFVRADVPLVVLVVSDEEDCSDEGLLDGYSSGDCYRRVKDLPPVSFYLDLLDEVKVAGGEVRVGAIVGTKTSPCDAAYATKRYAEAADLTGGMVGDICTSDWDGLMYDLGMGAIGIATSWTLTEEPVVASIEVWVDDVVVTEDPHHGWTYDEATRDLRFHGEAVPGRGAEIHVRYEVR